jgi:electron transfer flavoprotein-quinone oxidoreductase
MADDFDAIVVGAGMAGNAAALRLAQGGANVLLLERAAEAGTKNLSGGVLWGHDLDAVLPHWETEMPLERHVVRKRFGMLTAEDAASFDYEDHAWHRPPYVAHTVLRARTDAWLAQQAEAAGATVVTGVPVERLNWEGDRVHGIVQGGETMTAPLTVLCDGANSRLALGTPIRPDTHLDAQATELGMKEVYRLDPATIEDRFQVGPGEAHVEEWVAGFLPPGVMGGGFVYTNRDSVSVGLILQLGSLFGANSYSHDLMERFKLHPAIQRRIAGAELVEYGAKLISSGWASRPRAFAGDGWMVAGDAAGFVFSNGIVIQGMNYAIRSGLLAADAILDGRRGNAAPGAIGQDYLHRLGERGVLADFREFERLDRVKWDPRFYSQYPLFARNLCRAMMGETGAPKEPLWKLLRRAQRTIGISTTSLLRDGLELVRDL